MVPSCVVANGSTFSNKRSCSCIVPFHPVKVTYKKKKSRHNRVIKKIISNHNRFQEWLRRAGMGGGLEARGRALVAFGAHKGKKFADVFQSEPGYCDWILRELNKGEATKALKVFGGYVADRRSVQQAAQQ